MDTQEQLREKVKSALANMRFDPHNPYSDEEEEEKNDGILRVSKSFYMDERGVVCEVSCPKGIRKEIMFGVIRVFCERIGAGEVSFTPSVCCIHGKKYFYINDNNAHSIGYAALYNKKSKFMFRIDLLNFFK